MEERADAFLAALWEFLGEIPTGDSPPPPPPPDAAAPPGSLAAFASGEPLSDESYSSREYGSVDGGDDDSVDGGDERDDGGDVWSTSVTCPSHACIGRRGVAARVVGRSRASNRGRRRAVHGIAKARRFRRSGIAGGEGWRH